MINARVRGRKNNTHRAGSLHQLEHVQNLSKTEMRKVAGAYSMQTAPLIMKTSTGRR